MRELFYLLILIAIISCKKDDSENMILNESDEFSVCNSLLKNCVNGNGKYCLFGYKWGTNGSFSPAGYNVQGPEEESGQITFSFQEENGTLNTHAQINLPSRSFSNLIDCAKSEIRNGLNSWSSAANIEFIELPENSVSDIRFFVADIRQSGVGYPNYQSMPCETISGNIIIQAGLGIEGCQAFYNFVLHEIGHAQGLGHVKTQNIMNPDFSDFNVTGLQDGDIEGITELYGKK